MTWQPPSPDKPATGSLLCPGTPCPSRIRCLPEYSGSKDNWNKGSQDTNIGSSCSRSPEKDPYEQLDNCSPIVDTTNLRDPDQRRSMSGKTLPAWENDSSSESDSSNETTSTTGSSSSEMQSLDELMNYQGISLFDIILPSLGSLPTMLNRLLSAGVVKSSMERLVVERAIVLGKKPENVPFLRIHAPSSGVVTKVKAMLLLMSFEEVSTSLIFCDGSTDIQLTWKLKEGADVYVPKNIGSPQTYTQKSGIPTSIRRPTPPWSED